MRQKLIIAAVAVPLALVVLIVGIYAYDEILTDDQISYGVSADGVDVSRMTQAEARQAIAAYEAGLATDPVEVEVDGTAESVLPANIGFEIDEDAVAAEAWGVRRSSNGFTNFFKWIGTRLGSPVDIEITPTIEPDLLTEVYADWNVTAIDKPAYDGGVVIVDGEPAPEYPQAGTRIDADAATPLIEAAAIGEGAEPVVLPLTAIVPRVTADDVDAAVAAASALVGSPVILRPDTPGADRTLNMEFSEAALTTALRSEIVTNSPAEVVTYLDPDVIVDIARTTAPVFEIPPLPASFEFDEPTRTISVIPHQLGKVVDLDGIVAAVEEAAAGSRSGAIPMMDGPPPDLTTEKAEAMGPWGEVSTFTTYHDCCANRVVNIQLLADEIGGSWVLPGDEFSINETAGKRTLAEGYRRAGAIIGGEVVCCDSPINVGGGTSQFATTLYNAVFFGCYEDVFHQPHSLYFSRYPFVREATLGFPAPDVIFKNDSESVLYIHTEYTPTSITVTLYGNNGGRECVSERAGNTITRVMTHPDGSVTRQSWTWNYRPKTTTTTSTTSTTTTTNPTTTTTSPSTTTTTVPDTTTTTSTTTTTMPPTTTTTVP